ncbi:hypothetical protein AB0C07_15825 [Actinoplanes missouriensis]|uniref:hypothetical protein n=1 Tax=Actinoplanes missouriensis TaxID=1866 RepID=UPI0033DF5D59
MALPALERARNGWEMQLATNFLGHFALVPGLREHLAAAGDARVVMVSSGGHLMAGVDFDDPQFERRPYDPWVAYGQSKTAGGADWAVDEKNADRLWELAEAAL